LKPLLWGEPPAVGGVGGTFPAPALPPQGETGKGESNQNSLLPQAITYWLMPESALSPQPPNSLEPLEARHSQFLKRVKPASLGGTNGCTQSGPPMLTIQAKPTYITYSCSQPEKLEQGYRKLLGSTGQVMAQAKRFSQEIVKGVKRSADVLQQAALEGMKKEIDTMLPRVQQVVSQTRARIIHGVTNSAGKIVSLFEHTTEIIRKGNLASPPSSAR